jgi:hypothetical protein
MIENALQPTVMTLIQHTDLPAVLWRLSHSKDRPVTVRVIVMNRAGSSTTLVISRATGETETHIAWLHYFRLDGK